MLASIIIRTKNEERFLEKTLSIICEQTISDHEIIVVDSGSTDHTLAIAQKYNCQLIEIKPSDFTYGYALNIGAAKATGSLLVFLSAHAIPASQEWLAQLTEAFKDPKTAGVYGRQLPMPDAIFQSRQACHEAFPNRPITYRDESVRFSNANAAIRKSLWEQNPFDETLSGSEDIDWAKKQIEQGYQIVYAPNASAYHSHNETMKQIYTRSFRETLAMKKICPSLSRTKGQFTHYYLGCLKKDLLYLTKHFDIRSCLSFLIKSPFYRFVQQLAEYRAIHE